jgi:hypothetical protein
MQLISAVHKAGALVDSLDSETMTTRFLDSLIRNRNPENILKSDTDLASLATTI